MAAATQRDHDQTAVWRLGLIFVVLGALFGVDAYFRLALAVKLWPLLLVVLAVGLFGLYRQRHAREPAYLLSAVYVLAFSVLALYCNFAGWGHLSSLWPLFIAFLGLALVAVYFSARRHRLPLLLGLLLLSLAGVFLVVKFAGAQLWWTAFLFLGASLLLAGRTR